MRPKNYVLLAVVMLLLAACSQSGSQPVALATPLNQQGTPTPTATRASGTSPTVTPGQQRVLDANASVTTALFGITTATANIKAASALATPRKAISDALGSVRARLSAERTAAFGSVRNCPGVLSNAAQVRSAAAGVATGRARLAPVTANMRTQVNGLTQAVAVVAARLTALQGSLRAEPHPPAVVSASDVQTAMTSARTLASDTLTAAATADASASADVSKAFSLSGQAGAMATKTC
jgi:hypothetical protein